MTEINPFSDFMGDRVSMVGNFITLVYQNLVNLPKDVFWSQKFLFVFVSQTWYIK
ncbi:hypothetical protein N0824_01895 [Microcystis sp. 0824]|nr:hypothetical protein N0824_01895 [Microcystis sp. 0824]